MSKPSADIVSRWGLLLGWIVVAVLLLLFYGLPFLQEDYNTENLDTILATGFMEIARVEKSPLLDFFQNDSRFENLKTQSPYWAFAYFNRSFIYDYQAHYAPLLNLAYLPFIKLFGVTPLAVAAYGTFFGLLALFLTALLAYRLYGKLPALLAPLFILMALTWLIHVRSASQQPALATCLLMALALCLHEFRRTSLRSWLVGAGIFLGLIGLITWIVLPVGVLLSGALLLFHPGSWQKRLKSFLLLSLMAFSTALLVLLGYAWFYNTPLNHLLTHMHAGLFGRFSQDTNPGVQIGWGTKLWMPFRCLFWDMQTPDHPDKYLEGTPSVPWLFTLFFVTGLGASLRQRGESERLLFLWMLVGLASVTLLVTYANRYALLLLPAMAIVAAQGVLFLFSRLRPRYRPLTAVALLTVALLTYVRLHHDYFQRFTQERPPNFEVDRVRGHHALFSWIKAHHPPSDTLLVLSDPIMVGHQQFQFYTFDQPYRFIYWSNYAHDFAKPETFQHFQQEALSKYRTLLFVFAGTLLGTDKPDTFINDPRPFQRAYPYLQPNFTYSYNGRGPLLYAFAVDRPSQNGD